MPDLFEWIKTLGSIVGFVTGAFVVIDRFMRDRPAVSLSATKGRVELRVHNSGDADILVEKIEITPESVRVAVGSDLIDTIRAAADDKFSAVVRAGTSAAFPVITTRAWDGLTTAEPVDFTVRWSLARSRWLWQRPVRIKTTVGFIRKMHVAKNQADAFTSTP